MRDLNVVNLCCSRNVDPTFCAVTVGGVTRSYCAQVLTVHQTQPLLCVPSKASGLLWFCEGYNCGIRERTLWIYHKTKTVRQSYFEIDNYRDVCAAIGCNLLLASSAPFLYMCSCTFIATQDS